MTSEFNARYRIQEPKRVIGTERGPKPEDFKERELPLDLPDEDPNVALHRAALKFQSATLMTQQQIINDMRPESSIRDSLTVLADPHKAPDSSSDWETMTPSSPEMDEGLENYIADSFIAKVRGDALEKVKAARVAKRRAEMQAFIRQVRTVSRRRGSRLRLTAPTRPVSPPLASPSRAAAEADARDAARALERERERTSTPTPTPARPPIPPGTTRELTIAQATLALTNSQMGTNVTMEEAKTVMEIEDDEETYTWGVPRVKTRELTVAEAALVFTNMQMGTNLTMEDVRTARLMVDLWDDEDVYQWTVGNME